MKADRTQSFLTIQTATGWKQVLERFVDWIQPGPGWRALDLGCGPGLLSKLLEARGCLAFGLDLEHPGITRLHSLLIQGDVVRLPFSDASFDLLTASNLLFLLPDPQLALNEMRRLLATGGQIVVLNPSKRLTLSAAQQVAEARRLEGAGRESLLDWARRAEMHVRWNEAELGDLFAQVGLVLVETAYQVGPGFALVGRGMFLQKG